MTKEIPKMIHQVWIGPNKLPEKWIDSWRYTYLSYFPNWKYKLWRDKDIEEFGLKNKDYFDSEPGYSGKVNIIRYEILERLGGVYIDADCEYLDINERSLNELISMSKDKGFFISKEPSVSFYANSVIGSIPNHPIISDCVKHICDDRDFKIPSWKRTGPLYITKHVELHKDKYKVVPTHWFYPIKWHGIKVDDYRNINCKIPEDSIMFQYGYSTNNLKKII